MLSRIIHKAVKKISRYHFFLFPIWHVIHALVSWLNLLEPFFGMYLEKSKKYQTKVEAYFFKHDKDLENEMRFFATLLEDPSIIESDRTTKRLWKKIAKRYI